MLVFFLISFGFTCTSSYSFVDIDFQRLKPRVYFDLGYPLTNESNYFPKQKNFGWDKSNGTVQAYDYKYSTYSVSGAETSGTHLDAPFQFNSKGWTVDQIPSTNLIDVPAVVIDVSKEVNELRKPSEFMLEVKHIMDYEISNRMIPFGAVVLIYTGWSQFWPDKTKYLGLNNYAGRETTYNFPGISEIACKWLMTERKILGIGLDTASVDPGASKTFPVHVATSQNQVYNLKNVANLHLLLDAAKQNCYLHLFVSPLKIVGGTGAPTNILAYCR